jgi:hypothetical protein
MTKTATTTTATKPKAVTKPKAITKTRAITKTKAKAEVITTAPQAEVMTTGILLITVFQSILATIFFLSFLNS